MPSLVKYLLHRATWRKLPILPYSYKSEFELEQIDRDTERIMDKTRARCPQDVAIMVQRHNTSARELAIELETRHYQRRIIKRL